MISSAKTFFPEIFEAIKGWPLWFRTVLFLFVIAAPLIGSIFKFGEIHRFITTSFSVTPLSIAISIAFAVSLLWLLSAVNHKSKRQRLIYQFCESWLEYLPFMFILVTKIQGHEMRQDGQIFEFKDANKEDLKKFHEWRSKLRELLFKVGEEELYIADNQHWEKLKKESKIFEAQPYLTPFSFILDQTQPWLIALVHQNEAWAALHISDEFIERIAFKHPKVERLWKKRQKDLEQVAKNIEQNA